MIQLVDGKNYRLAVFIHMLPYQLCAHFHAMLRVDQHHSGVSYAKWSHNFTDEIIQTRCVNNVNLVVAPFRVKGSGIHGNPAFVFQFMIVTHRVLLFDRTSTVNDFRFKQHGFGKGRLAASRPAHQYDVADVILIKDLHNVGIFVQIVFGSAQVNIRIDKASVSTTRPARRFKS